MPLLDHFHAPLYPARQWSSLHAAWATTIAGSLNAKLPSGDFAAPNLHFHIEVDVASMQRPGAEWPDAFEPAQRWQPGAPSASIPFALTTDEIEVQIFEESAGATMIGAIELVSPANKDRPATRNDFNARCQSYLKMGIGLLVVDVVTTRWADLHAELMGRLDPNAVVEPVRSLAATSYRPGVERLAIWREALTVGGDLPTMPLWLRTGPSLAVDLGATYEPICSLLKLGDL